MIYFLRHVDTGLIKIGKTKDKNARLSTLIKEYGDLELLGLLAGYTEKERELHLLFRDNRSIDVLDGVEWFEPTKTLLSFIDTHATFNLPLPIFGEIRPCNLRSNLPNLVYDYLDETGITQKELAELAEIKPSQLSRLLRSDPVQIDLRTLEALSKFIEFDYGNLVVEVAE